MDDKAHRESSKSQSAEGVYQEMGVNTSLRALEDSMNHVVTSNYNSYDEYLN